MPADKGLLSGSLEPWFEVVLEKELAGEVD